MRLSRMFSTLSVKGTKGYLDTQKKYELLRTVLYFAISFSLFLGGYLQTGDRVNLLTIVAILGCLPGSKSAVTTIMYFRFHSCSPKLADSFEQVSDGLPTLFDCIFTSYKKNYVVSHLAVVGNTVCGFSEDVSFDENSFYKHIDELLKLDGHKNVTVKIFTNQTKYLERLSQMKQLEPDSVKSESILQTLKSIML